MDPNTQNGPSQNFGGVPTGPVNQKNNSKGRMYVIGGTALIVLVGIVSFFAISGEDNARQSNNAEELTAQAIANNTTTNTQTIAEISEQGRNTLSERGLSADPALVAFQFDTSSSEEDILAEDESRVEAQQQAGIEAEDLTIGRINGSNRFETAALASRAAFPSPGDVRTIILVNTGSDIDMALAASYASTDTVVLPVETNRLPDEIKTEIERLSSVGAGLRIATVGGPASISAEVYEEATNIVRNGNRSNTNTGFRVFGDTRIETAIEISKDRFPAGLTGDIRVAYLASENAPIDALIAANGTNSPVLLTKKDITPFEVTSELIRLNINYIIVVGGESVISDTAKNSIAEGFEARERVVPQLFEFRRLISSAGATRLETSIAVSERSYRNGSETAVLVNGFSIVDSLAAVNISQSQGGRPVILVNTNDYSTSTPRELQRLQAAAFVVVGGADSITDNNLSNLLSNTF